VRCTTTVTGSSTTCRLSDARLVVAVVVPPGWRVGVFGSTATCTGLPCPASSSDVDLAIVHPVGAERVALAVRRRLVADARTVGWVADVTVMSSSEAVSSGFWDGERVLDLDAARCPVR
jgi:hypothetical protein